MKKYLKFLIIALAVAVIVPQIAFASWWNPFSWGVWNRIFHFQQMQQQTQKNSTPIVGGDKDAHGCIGSAGYSWCEAKQKCLRPWEENCNILSDVYPIFGNRNLKWGQSVQKKEMNISGYEITATDKINSNTDSRNFFNYYDSKLKSAGWVVDNNFAADGITGSQVGYQNGGNYIILNYSIKPGKVTSGANEPLQWTCPCEVTYSIFTGTSETGQCTKDSDCPTIYCIKAPCPQNKCVNRTCQVTGQKSEVCPMYCVQNMLCGSDGKDYCNECLAKAAGTTIIHAGKCNSIQTYINSRHGYKISYSSGWKLEEIDTPPDKSACVSIKMSGNYYILINAQSAIPCGATGVGIGDVKKNEQVDVGGTIYQAQGFSSPDGTGFLSFKINNLYITYWDNSTGDIKNILKGLVFTN